MAKGKIKKTNAENFLFSESGMIKALGKEEVERLKREDYETYVTFRNSPIFMESDVLYSEEKSVEDIYQ